MYAIVRRSTVYILWRLSAKDAMNCRTFASFFFFFGDSHLNEMEVAGLSSCLDFIMETFFFLCQALSFRLFPSQVRFVLILCAHASLIQFPAGTALPNAITQHVNNLGRDSPFPDKKSKQKTQQHEVKKPYRRLPDRAEELTGDLFSFLTQAESYRPTNQHTTTVLQHGTCTARQTAPPRTSTAFRHRNLRTSSSRIASPAKTVADGARPRRRHECRCSSRKRPNS